MDETRIRRIVEDFVCEEFAKKGVFFVPTASSNRHIHLSKEHAQALFGKDFELTKLRDLKQPNQFASNQQVTFKTSKGSLTLRVVGPIRSETQIELSTSDCIKLGLPPVIRMSGDIEGTPCGVISTEKGSVTLSKGVIVAARHLHLSTSQAKLYGLKNGDAVRLFVEGKRATVFDNVQVRCGEAHILEAHIDVEEANACALPENAICRIEKMNKTHYLMPEAPAKVEGRRIFGNIVPDKEAPLYALSGAINQKTNRGAMPEPSKKRMLSEADVIEAHKLGQTQLLLDKDTLLTPLARDRARQLGMELTERR